ncbi:MAG: ABC transporter ATP-binding protein [Blastochloris sp.]|nr:ABC transporter ATP-binding protein [Blastochloris sp.]
MPSPLTMNPSAITTDLPDAPIIQARGVHKSFGNFQALKSLDMEVRRGECVGLLGPNGAGKSTFIGCLYGVVRRDGGELNVFSHDPVHHPRAIKSRLGVVPQENALDDGLTVLENMQIYARFGGLSTSQALPRIKELLAYMSLDHKSEAIIKTLSGGMKRRLAFVRALLAEPQLLLLDEPTTGLDPTVRHLLWEKVLSFKKTGKTVLVTTHYMHEAEILCDRIVILNKGEVAGAGTPKEMIERLAPGYVGIFSQDSEPLLRPLLDPARPGWELFHQGQHCCIRAPQLEDLVALQHSSGLTPLQLRPSNLEDVYLKLTGRELDTNE